jgi:hypothetical protein
MIQTNVAHRKNYLTPIPKMTSRQAITADLASDMNIEQLFQKHIIDGTSYFFREFLNNGDQEYELRHDISSALKININDVVIVGSAKLGFSVKNENFSKFDQKFKESKLKNHKSDIDIAIVNGRLFEEQSELIFELSRHFSMDWIASNWTRNVYYPNGLDDKDKHKIFRNYAQSIARGWLRPDYTPNSYINEIPWKRTIDNWYARLQRKIAVGLYSNWYYLKHYQMDNLISLRVKTRTLELPNA